MSKRPTPFYYRGSAGRKPVKRERGIILKQTPIIDAPNTKNFRVML